jgi:uncharacterized membrane protein
MEATVNKNRRLKDINKVRWITITALFMGLNIAMSSFGVPVPGGHLYLCDIVICTAALLLDPLAAFAVGGIGSFLGDMIFYPLPMFVSLAAHGMQAVVISLISHRTLKERPHLASGIGVAAGGLIMVVLYTLGKIYVYSTFEYAMIKLPYEIAQAALGGILGMILCWNCGIHKLYNRMING